MNKETIRCECGMKVTKTGYEEHLKGKKHLSKIKVYKPPTIVKENYYLKFN